MRLPYEALLICLVLFVNNGEGKKMSFTFKKTVGSNTLQIVDFHVMKGKSVKETDIYEKFQTIVPTWFECYRLCLGLSSECRSFNYKNTNGILTCQPTGVMPHLQSDKLEATSDEIWYMPYPVGTSTIA